jgi:hypothetical protein
METERRRQLLLAAVAIVLALVVYQAWPRTSAAPAAASNQRRAAAPATAGTSGTNVNANAATPSGVPVAPDVHLEALGADRPKPGPADRNLFRFKPKAPPPPPPTMTRPGDTAPPVVAPVPTGPPPPPPVPPITVKLIGIADRAGKGKVAVLSDGLGQPQVGQEGEVVFGRYRILKIGVESIEMAYLDGRGRQTIRLSGT